MSMGTNWVRLHPRRLGSSFDDGNGIQLDLVFVSNERTAIIAERGIDGSPDLVVEVLSPSTRYRDLGAKKRCHAAAGVPHYWIMDRRQRTLTARRLGQDGYHIAGVYGPGDTFTPNRFPGPRIVIEGLLDSRGATRSKIGQPAWICPMM